MRGRQLFGIERPGDQQKYGIAFIVLRLIYAGPELPQSGGVIALKKNPSPFSHRPIGEGREVDAE